MNKKIDLSVVITAHNEGLLAHKTMLSVFEGVKRLKDAGYTYEIIVHIDNGNKETKQYFNRYIKRDDVRVFSNEFGDLGSSRNYAAKEANGEYVSFLDGDDLMSDNWYVVALKKLKESKNETVIYPEAVLTFGIDQPNILTLQKPSLGIESDTLLLVGENRWGSVVMAKKELFLKYPYFKKTAGYNYEDYVFNIQTVEAGIDHEIARGTTLFYRRSDDSMLSNGNRNHATIPYVDLFDFERMRKIKTFIDPKGFEENRTIRKGVMYRKIRSNRFVILLVSPVAAMVKKITNRKIQVVKIVPDFVVKQWKDVNKIETQLYPYKIMVNRVEVYTAGGQIEVGNAFRMVADMVTHKPDYVFIVPWLVRGGAEKVLLNYLNALLEIHPGWKLTVITTLPSDNDWAEKLPNGVDLIEFGNLAEKMVPEMRETLFTRIITQLDCSNLHIINSEYGYKWVMNHKALVKNHYKITTSLFASEFIPESNMTATFSYDDPYLLSIYDVVEKVFTDNNTVIEETVAKNGYDNNKFTVHYQPVKKADKVSRRNYEDGKIHILWAGRIVKLKLPDIVAKIGKNLDSRKYVIDVYGEMSNEVRKNIFSGIKSIRYHGSFDGFDRLMNKKYDLFLYTSLTDGIPNTILEAASYGLPIIASNDGGVSEVIQNAKTGILIDNPLDVNGYIKAIKRFEDEPEVLEQYGENAKKLVEDRHSWESFSEAVKKDFKKL